MCPRSPRPPSCPTESRRFAHPVRCLLAVLALALVPVSSLAQSSEPVAPPVLAPLQVVQSTHADAAEEAGGLVTVHVLLQIHAQATLSGPVETPESRVCQDRIERTVLARRRERRDPYESPRLRTT